MSSTSSREYLINFLLQGTPQQNGVVERKNMTLIEAGKNNTRGNKVTYILLGRSYKHCLLYSELHPNQQTWCETISNAQREET